MMWLLEWTERSAGASKRSESEGKSSAAISPSPDWFGLRERTLSSAAWAGTGHVREYGPTAFCYYLLLCYDFRGFLCSSVHLNWKPETCLSNSERHYCSSHPSSPQTGFAPAPVTRIDKLSYLKWQLTWGWGSQHSQRHRCWGSKRNLAWWKHNSSVSFITCGVVSFVNIPFISILTAFLVGWHPVLL